MQPDYTGKYITITATYNLDDPRGIVADLFAQVTTQLAVAER